MRTILFLISLLLLVMGSGFSDDYNFTITGELPVSKLTIPGNIFRIQHDFDYRPQKNTLNLINSEPIVTLMLNPPSKETDIVYAPSKKLSLIDGIRESPQKLSSEIAFFDLDRLVLIHKPQTLTLMEQKTGGITISLANRKTFQIPEIQYRSKVKFFQLPDPPRTEPVQLSQDRFYLVDSALPFNPLKLTDQSQSRISLGTIDLKIFRLGFSNPNLEAVISNESGLLFFKNESLYIGAKASLNEISASAYFPGFEFGTSLFNQVFVVRTAFNLDLLPSFDFGLALINTTPLPVINWYTTGSPFIFSIGVDLLSQNAYGIGVRLKNDPFVIRAGTGYDFSTQSFHAMVDGRYVFNNGLFNASLSYSDSITLSLGSQYQLINSNPFSMSIYGNIDYHEDWLFSAGTQLRIGDVDLNARIKFITGGLSVDVEAGYSF